MDRAEELAGLDQQEVRQAVDPGSELGGHLAQVAARGERALGDHGDQLVHRLEAARLDDRPPQVVLGEEERPRPAAAPRRSGDPELGRQGEEAARLEDAPHLVRRRGHVREIAEVLDRARREDRVEARVGETKHAAVHVLHGEAVALEGHGAHALGIGEQERRGVALPGAGREIEVGRHHPAGVPGEVEQRALGAGPDPQHRRVPAQDPEVAESAHGHRYLPVLAVLAARRKAGPPPRRLVREDLAHQRGEAGIGEVLDLQDLVVGQRSLAHAVSSSRTRR